MVLKFLLIVSLSLAVCYGRDCTWMKKRLIKSYDDSYQQDIDRIYPWKQELETLLNYQIRIELNAFYNYLSMSHFFAREDQYLEGFSKYFRDAATEELKHAEMFMGYQAKRGGRVTLYSLPQPERQSWENGMHTLKSALLLEKNVTDEILCLHQMASKYRDVDFVNLLEGEVIPEQYSGMKELTTHIKTLARMSSASGKDDLSNYGLAEAHFDKAFQK